MTKAQAQAWPARRLPAEWEPAGAVLLAWPRADGDWAPYLEDVRACYRRLLAALSALAPVLLLVDEPERVLLELGPELAALTRQPFSPPGPASANGSGAGGAAASGPSTTGSASGEPITGALAAPRLPRRRRNLKRRPLKTSRSSRSPTRNPRSKVPSGTRWWTR